MVAAPALAAASVLASTLAFAQAGGSPEWEAQYGRSSGCGEAPPYNPSNPNDSLYVNVEIDGLERGYLLHLPTSYDQDRPSPLVMSFHGWSMDAQSNKEWMGFTANIEQENYITVFPDGKRDCLGQSNCWSSWNAGGASTNGPGGPGPNGGWTCHQSTGNCQACADSCAPLGVCNSDNQRNCNWATCVDDISFVSQLLDKLEDQLCVDRARVFASGESLGGMMAWQVAESLPRRFAAVAPTVGAPHEGWTAAPSATEQISVLNLHARNDNTVPPGGGQSSDGWFFDSVDAMMAVWGAYNQCSGASRTWPNPVGSGPGNTNLACTQPEGACESAGTAVITCAMNGGHFTQIRNFFGELSYFFFQTHPKTEAWFVANKMHVQLKEDKMAVKTANKMLLADAILLLPLDEPAAKNGTAAPSPHGSLVL